MIYFGVVEDVYDPEELGRVRVRVFGLHSANKLDIPTSALPWAIVMTPTTSPSISGVGHTPFIVQGSWVALVFIDDALQDPMVIGTIPGKPAEKRSDSVGFSDPYNSYPKWIDDSDLSYSSRKDKFPISDSYLKKSSLRNTNIQTANPPKVTSVSPDKDESYYADHPWNEPTTSNEHIPSYPSNHVYETESGHLVEYDDTPGHERYHRYHPAGSYEEIFSDGSRILKIIGKNYHIVLDDQNMFIEGDLNVTVTGDMRYLVEGNYHIEVEKDLTFNVKGSMQTKIGINQDTEVGRTRSTNIGANDHLTTIANQIVNILGSKTDNISLDYSITTSKNHSHTSFGDMSYFSKGNFKHTNLGTLTMTSKGNITVETPANVLETFGGNQTTIASGNVLIDASRIDLNP